MFTVKDNVIYVLSRVTEANWGVYNVFTINCSLNCSDLNVFYMSLLFITLFTGKRKMKKPRLRGLCVRVRIIYGTFGTEFFF